MGFVPEINVFVFVYIYCIVEMLVLPSIQEEEEFSQNFA